MEPSIVIDCPIGPFGPMPADLTAHILGLLPSGDDAAYFGATCKQLHTIVVQSIAWKDRLRREYPLSFASLEDSESKTSAPKWYSQYRKDKAARRFLVEDKKSQKLTQTIHVNYPIPSREGAHFGRRLIPAVVENGKKVALLADRHLMVVDLATAKTVQRLRFGTELFSCHQV